MFYLRFALNNFKKNKQVLIPFLLVNTFLCALNLLTAILAKNPDLKELPGGVAVEKLFKFGEYVIIIFSVILAIYAASILIKQRKREVSLYNILGLGKHELYKLSFYEKFICLIISLCGGLISGIVFSRLGFLVFSKLIGVKQKYPFSILGNSIGQACLIIVLIFGLIFLLDCFSIRKSNPTSLLKASKRGEKEIKSNYLVALIGFGCLFIGYYMSLTIESPLIAIKNFFIAVVLVIVATYGIFIAGSIVILKLFKNNKKFYYKTKNMIPIANMIYRMKQNATGLASICILATMSLITIISTASLYVGQEVRINKISTTDIVLYTPIAKKEEVIQKIKQERSLVKGKIYSMEIFSNFLLKKEGKSLEPTQFNKVESKDFNNLLYPTVTTLSQFNTYMNGKEKLAENEMLIYSESKNFFKHKQIDIAGEKWNVKLIKRPKIWSDGVNMGVSPTLIVIRDNQISRLKNLKARKYQQFAFDIKSPNNKEKVKLANDLLNKLSVTGAMSINREDTKQALENIYGGFLFLGSMFGITFILATALIIYYKQISEGIDDKKRFDTLQKVGMSHKEVKRVIGSQIIMVFLSPLLIAIMHVIVAFPLLKKMLLLFGLIDVKMFLYVMIGTSITFSIIYYIVYLITAKAYYHLVER